MRKILVTLGLVVTTVLATMGVASAHQAVSISATINCRGVTTINGTADWWGGIALHVYLNGSEIATFDTVQTDQDHSVRPFGPITGTGAVAGDTVSARTDDQEGGVSATVVLVGSPCPVKHKRFRPYASIQTCGDPLVRAFIGNTGKRAGKVRVFVHGVLAKTYTVPSNSLYITPYWHLFKGQSILVKAQGRVLAKFTVTTYNVPPC